MSRDVRAARTGVLSKYRKEFPICTFSLAKNIDNVTPPTHYSALVMCKIFIGERLLAHLIAQAEVFF